MQSKQINIKLMPELDEKLELISKILNIPKVEWARNIIAHEVVKEIEAHKSFVAIEYMKGKISKKDLVKILGDEQADEIDFIIEKTKEDIKKAKELVKKLRSKNG